MLILLIFLLSCGRLCVLLIVPLLCVAVDGSLICNCFFSWSFEYLLRFLYIHNGSWYLLKAKDDNNLSTFSESCLKRSLKNIKNKGLKDKW